MSDPVLATLTVRECADGSALHLGQVFPIHGTVASIGRTPEHAIVLSDPTVSRRHAVLDLDAATVANVSSGNGAFVDGVPIEPGATASLKLPACRVQIGGVLLDLLVFGETEKVVEPLGGRDATRFWVRWDGGACAIRIGERWVDLPPAEAQLLGTLLERAGEPVHRWDLEERAGPHLKPLVSRLRGRIAEWIEAGLLHRSEVQSWVAELTGAESEDPARALISSRRGHGYLVCVPPSRVSVETV